MNYPLWCDECMMLTGHEIRGFTSCCLKCGTERPSPWRKWLIGGIALAIASAAAFLFIVACIWNMMLFLA